MHIARLGRAASFILLTARATVLQRGINFGRRRGFSHSVGMASEGAATTHTPEGMLSVGLEPFCFRQFDDPKYPGTVIPMDKDMFMKQLHEILKRKSLTLVDGYAPFCKHLFIENFTEARASAIPITEDNVGHIRTGYLARRPEELPVLSRWLPASVVRHQLHRAKYLDLILYSREQIAKENAAMTKSEVLIDPTKPEWFIVSIKAQDEPFELPMNPITIMRNALIEEGGSGVSINREAYARSVEYWSNHVVVQED
ncbi:hypothetical protein, conserved [Eimeria necatrix]|uniref:Uncharacterized protein n=1 Tax=Eimeria necatrix TaxID=51315 RepID=U6MDV5_9EIME|nr:hypothetical protein, conserved [Eimeria necatrix]CDJ62432.1 hypothetical protein, conserved [Eimeria necatrix]